MRDFVCDIGRFLNAVLHEFKWLLGILGLTVLRFWKPLYGKDIPNSVFWFGVCACLFFAVLFAWRKERKRTILAKAFRESLKARCDDVILKWEELAELCQNAQKEVGQPATLPDPMAPWWGSAEWKYLPYKVGSLQASTVALRQDLKRTSVPVEEYDPRISMPRLLDALRKYKEQIANFS